MAQLRAIVGARTSTINADKVSHVTQTETGGKYATDNGMEVIGTFQDLGVSATVSPFDRPDLGPWLTERVDDYDVIIWSKVDRAFRSSFDSAAVVKWAQKHKKILVFTDDGLKLNYHNEADPMAAMHSEMFVTMSSMFAQQELHRMTQRANDREAALRYTDRFPKGVPPFGFRVVPHPSGSGKALTRDQGQYQTLHTIAGLLLDGWSLNGIAKWLNDQGVKSNVAKAGDRETRWSVKNATELLTSPKTQGIKTHNGEPVLGEDGLPVVMAEATFSPEMWTQIQTAIAERRASGNRRVHSTSPILGVGFCECGASLTPKTNTYKGKTYTFYRCGRTPGPCKGIGIKAAEAHETLDAVMTKTFGGMRATRRVFVPGSDNSAELETVEKAITRLRRESDLGLIDDEDEYFSRMMGLTERKRELLSTPYRAAGYETVQEEDTYADKYAAADATGRRDILRNAGIRLTLHTEGEPTLTLPEPMADAFGIDELPVSKVLDTGYGRLVGNFVRAGMRGDI